MRLLDLLSFVSRYGLKLLVRLVRWVLVLRLLIRVLRSMRL